MQAIINTLKPKLSSIFTYLHEHPEVSWNEHATTAYIKKLLSDYDCRIMELDGIPGLIVEIGHGQPVVAVRADMDALWQEVDGKFQANHSCGHDAHMTIALGTLLILPEVLPPTGTFRFIFQPAEEKGTGALAVVEQGIVDDVDFLYGMHLRPAEELADDQFAPAIHHGAACFIEGVIHGEDAHGARPHLNTNAILVGSEIVQYLNNLQLNPNMSYSAKMTAFHAGGESSNIIPGNGTFKLDLRAQTNDIMDKLMIKVEHIVNMLSDYHDISIELKIGANIAAAVVNNEAAGMMEQAIIDRAGPERMKPAITTTGGDDFHFYTIEKPHIKATMLAIGCDLKPGLHHPHMTFNRDVIPKAVKILTDVLLKTVERGAGIDQ
ncbi:M20 peptidase aminoacylase family protein [Virgibacillus siamensis]|uniref:M20 peptidase aminoacylase family protein n=1 Tax=Virgibacillus siamensis TaxID=480071 RepID=A0ABN1FNN9_9BACI